MKKNKNLNPSLNQKKTDSKPKILKNLTKSKKKNQNIIQILTLQNNQKRIKISQKNNQLPLPHHLQTLPLRLINQLNPLTLQNLKTNKFLPLNLKNLSLQKPPNIPLKQNLPLKLLKQVKTNKFPLKTQKENNYQRRKPKLSLKFRVIQLKNFLKKRKHMTLRLNNKINKSMFK